MEAESVEKTIDLAFHARGVTRRDFMKFCSCMAAVLGLPPVFATQIADAIEMPGSLKSSRRPSVLWLQLQECAGCTESFARASNPSVAQAVLDHISLDYHETLMAAAGSQARAARKAAMQENAGQYVLIVEGSVPASDGGIYCMMGGQSGLDLLREMASGAAFVIALGTCASYGGLAAARPNPTGAQEIGSVLPDKRIVRIPGCPPLGDVIMGTLAYYLVFKKPPALDEEQRPLFAYGKFVHEQCRRHSHYEVAEMCGSFGDSGCSKAYCLFPLGCKGQFTRNACTVIRSNMSASWCVGSGHPCVGCSERNFWDEFTPIYTLRERRDG
jgi:hydrogenase small subunit